MSYVLQDVVYNKTNSSGYKLLSMLLNLQVSYKQHVRINNTKYV